MCLFYKLQTYRSSKLEKKTQLIKKQVAEGVVFCQGSQILFSDPSCQLSFLLCQLTVVVVQDCGRPWWPASHVSTNSHLCLWISSWLCLKAAVNVGGVGASEGWELILKAVNVDSRFSPSSCFFFLFFFFYSWCEQFNVSLRGNYYQRILEASVLPNWRTLPDFFSDYNTWKMKMPLFWYFGLGKWLQFPSLLSVSEKCCWNKWHKWEKRPCLTSSRTVYTCNTFWPNAFS